MHCISGSAGRPLISLLGPVTFHSLKRYCYVEECANSNLCGLITDLQPTNTTVEMDCAIKVLGLERIIHV